MDNDNGKVIRDNKKPDNLGPKELWYRVDKDKRRIQIDAPLDIACIEVDHESSCLFIITLAQQELFSYGIIEKGRQLVEKFAVAKEIESLRKDQIRRQLSKGANA